MFGNRPTTVALVLLVAGVLLPAPAAADSPADGPEPRLYTNADLERHPVATGTATAVAPEPGGEAGWQFVADHLARQHRQIEQGREAALERRRAEAEASLIERSFSEESYWLPWGVPVACSGRAARHDPWCRPHRRPGTRPGHRDGGSGDDIRPIHARGRITPLHARGRLAPMPTTRGQDAVPQR